MEPRIVGASESERQSRPFGSELRNVLLAHQAVGDALGRLRTAAQNAGEADYERYADSLIRYASDTAQELRHAETGVATRIERGTQSRCDTVCPTCGVGFGFDCPCGHRGVARGLGMTGSL